MYGAAEGPGSKRPDIGATTSWRWPRAPRPRVWARCTSRPNKWRASRGWRSSTAAVEQRRAGRPSGPLRTTRYSRACYARPAMPELRSTSDRLELALACAAISRGLRSILLLDASEATLLRAVNVLARLIRELTGREAIPVPVASAAGEDDLWNRPRLLADDTGYGLLDGLGPLALSGDERQVPVLVVRDLARLELPAARGLLLVLDCDVAHLERNGASRTWRPDAFCVAACDRQHAAGVSAHLLDRFALRLKGVFPLESRDRSAAIVRWLDATDIEPPAHHAAWAAPTPPWPRVTQPALDHVLHYLATRASNRRAIALARLAVAVARLETPGGAVLQAHVDRAAELMGLRAPLASAPAPDAPADEAAASTPEISADANEERPATIVSADTGDHGVGVGPGTRSIDVPAAEAFPASELTASAVSDPYPEDAAGGEHMLALLKDVPTRFRSRSVPRGRVVGIQQTRTAHDLALLATLLTAAKWQPYRAQHCADPGDGGMSLWPTDLRTYRRAPDPEHVLALLLDFTCLEGWDWPALLLAHLRWAYARRAAICLVRVGAADAHPDTRADRLITRNLLDPRLDRALDASSGHATPLAHGLQLAGQTLRHGIHHGQGVVRHARLVVATDGRGNVPLHLGPDLTVQRAVERAGIEDALVEARKIRALSAVETVVLDPQPALYPRLVADLAQALGAAVVRDERGRKDYS